MISTTLLLVLGGCALGIVQLLAGIGIGMWLRRDDGSESNRDQQDMQQAGVIAKRLQALAKEVSTSVGEHQTRLGAATQALTTDDKKNDESLAELVVDVIDDIVRANHSLQSKLESAECRLQEQAAEIETHISRSLTDPLTGLPNRREFDVRLAERMSVWNRRQEKFTLLLLDVDMFKQLNDQHGHLIGDRVLAGIGSALRAAVRREDAVARYGGEEFAVLLPATSLDQAARAAQNVREAIGRISIEHNGRRLGVTVSGGLATIQRNESPDSLIQRADAAMYAAKAAGRNCAFLHDGTLCRPAAGNPAPRRDAPQPAAHSKPTPKPAAELATSASTPMLRDEISPELAKTCEELRRFVEERDEAQLQTAAATPA